MYIEWLLVISVDSFNYGIKMGSLSTMFVKLCFFLLDLLSPPDVLVLRTTELDFLL